MHCNIASLKQMGAAVSNLTKHTELSVVMTEETRYYLKVVLNELIINSFKYGGPWVNHVIVSVDMLGESLAITVDDGGCGMDPSTAGFRADIYSEGGRGLAIVRGLCQTVEWNPAGNCVTAVLSLHHQY
jgi:anti-sigma regulatory factor (Ser/Thr protein kinase)